MNDLPFDLVNLLADDIQTLKNSYKVLKSKFATAVPGISDDYINKFELFNKNPSARIGCTLFINYPETNCYLNFIKSNYTYSNGGRGGKGGQSLNYDNYQVWAFVNLKHDFGRVLIRKETFIDKLLETVHPTELKFNDDKVFSDHFYVVTNDKEKAAAAITSNFRTIIINMMYKDFVLEIINKTLVIRTDKPIDQEQIISLAEIAVKLASAN